MSPFRIIIKDGIFPFAEEWQALASYNAWNGQVESQKFNSKKKIWETIMAKFPTAPHTRMDATAPKV